MDRFSRDQILAALSALAEELRDEPRQHELIVAGGAAMVLLYGARESTRDVDAVVAGRETLLAARRAAVHVGLPEDWLNDAAKGYLHGLAVGPTVPHLVPGRELKATYAFDDLWEAERGSA